ncbi:hypothetical protein Tco_1294659 [Tanacetum coccineum]
MSTAEAEYVVAAAGCCANILWIKSQLTDYDIIYEKIPIFCDNTSAISISNNPVLHSRTKHIFIRYQFIRDHIIKGDIELHFIPTQYQLADIFTKPLDEPTFKRLIVELAEFWYTAKTLEGSKIWVSTPIGARPWFSLIGYNGEIGAKGTLKKSCLPPRWRLLMAQIIWCLGGKTGGLDQISNNDATILYCLANGLKVDFASIIWEDIIYKLNKKTREKVVPYPRFIYLLLEYMMPEYDHEDLTINLTQVFSVHNWALKLNQPEEPPFTDHMKAICNANVPGIDEGTQNYSLDHKFARINLSVLVDKTKSLGHGLKTAHTDLGTNEESRSDEISKKIKLEDLSNLMQDTRSAFFSPDSPQDEPIILLDESEEEETKRYKDT